MKIPSTEKLKTPTPDSADNEYQRDVEGNKDDTIAGNSAISILKQMKQVVVPGNHHEKVYPYDSEGVEVAPFGLGWGPIIQLIPIDAITDDYGWNTGTIKAYNVIGFSIMLEAGANRPNTYNVLRIVKTTGETLSGDAAALQKVIPIPDTSKYLVDDYVWVTDDDTPDGELGKVASIITNTSITMVDNLGKDYTTAENAKVYLARRLGDNNYRSIWGKFGHSDTKSVIRFNLHSPRAMEAGDGLIVRAYGLVDDTGLMLMSVIYDDEA